MIFWLLAVALALALAAFMAAPLVRRDAGLGARGVGAAVGAAAPLVGLAVYLAIGAPQLARLDGGGAQREEAAAASARIAALERAVEIAPGDADAWRRLVAARLERGDFDDAIVALERLIALRPDDASLQSALGEALVQARGGVVDDRAQAAFEAALAGQPDDVAALFYLAEADYQAGRRGEALRKWGELAEAAPQGAPWLRALAQRMARALTLQERSFDSLDLSEETVVALEGALRRPVAPPRGPTEEQAAAAAELDDEQRAQMVESMVAGLAARMEENPDDLEGWRMLARSYRTLGRLEESANAFRQIARLAPEELEAKRNYAYALWLARADVGAPDEETVAAFEALLSADERDPVALLALAEAAEAGGDAERARALLARVIEDDDAPDVLRDEARSRMADLQ